MIKQKLKPCKTCGDPSYIWAHGNCKRCDGMLRAQKIAKEPRKHITLAQSDKKVNKPFKAIGDKQSKRLAKYRVARDEYFEINPWCEYPGCSSREITLHHGAGKTGDLLFNKKYFKSLCFHHHRIVEEQPDLAKQLGLSFDRLDK